MQKDLDTPSRYTHFIPGAVLQQVGKRTNRNQKIQALNQREFRKARSLLTNSFNGTKITKETEKVERRRSFKLLKKQVLSLEAEQQLLTDT